MTPRHALAIIEVALDRSGRQEGTARPRGRPPWAREQWQDLAQAWAGFELLRTYYGDPDRQAIPRVTVSRALLTLQRSIEQRRRRPSPLLARAIHGFVLVEQYWLLYHGAQPALEVHEDTRPNKETP